VKLPKYRRRPDRDSAFVEWQGKRHPLPGRFDSPESLAAYHDLCQRIIAFKESQAPPPQSPARPLSVGELAIAYLDFARTYYLKEGRPGSEYGCIRQAVKPLLRCHGETPADRFGPLALKQVRQAMVSGSWITADDQAKAWSRKVVNKHVDRIRRMFRWGAENEMVPASVVLSLKTVQSLRAGKTAAKERPQVEPVPDARVDAVLPFLTPVVSGMVQLQRLTGMRSESLVLMRPCDIDTSGDVWLYRPPQHKTKHQGKQLIVALGPKAQAILRPFLDRDQDAFCFSPAESERFRRDAMRSRRKTPVYPCEANRQPKARPKRTAGTRYRTTSYRRAVERACEEAFGMPAELRIIPSKAAPEEKLRIRELASQWRAAHCWNPHQLRHSVGTLVRSRYTLEGAQVYLGHSSADVTQIYAERDLELARRIAREIG
jgi:integrase